MIFRSLTFRNEHLMVEPPKVLLFLAVLYHLYIFIIDRFYQLKHLIYEYSVNSQREKIDFSLTK